MFKPISLAIFESQTLFRKTLKSYLSEQTDINVSIQASNISDLFIKLRETSVDIVIMDIVISGVSGHDAVIMLKSHFPAIKIVILSTCMDVEMISDLLEAGIHGYVSKSEEPEELLQAIRAVSENRIYRNRLFTEALYWNKQNNFNLKTSSEKFIVDLSEREKKVLQLIWEEKSNKEIAEELFLGIRSIEKIRQDMKEKICAKSTVGLLKYAINKKIIGLSMKDSGIIN